MTLPEADVWVMNADGSDARVVVPHGAPGVRFETPVWAPDGTALFVSQVVPVTEYGVTRDRVAGVLRVSLDGSVPSAVWWSRRGRCQASRLTAGVWSASCSARTAARHSPWQTRAAANDDARPVGVDAGDDGAARFSPDGKQIVFTAFLDDEGGPGVPAAPLPAA